MKKIGIFIGTLLILAAVPATAWAGTYSGGSGTSGDPYQIANTDDLIELSNTSTDWSLYFEQTADITFNSDETQVDWDGDGSATWDTEDQQGFSPIGVDHTSYFSGTYDGQGHIIDNLYINRPSENRVGLFGYLNNSAIIRNLGATNVDITAEEGVGGMVGYSFSADIEHCYTTGNVTSSDGASSGGHVGGFIGELGVANISSCYSTCTVTDDWQTGEDDYGCAGGFIGRNQGSTCSITDCYATGTVTGHYRVGGFAGMNYNQATIDNCYSKGAVTGDSLVGGLVGMNGSSSVESDSFWDTETSGQSSSAGGTGKTTAEMQTQSTFTDAGWDFTNTWEMTEGVTYPLLQGLEGQPPIPEWPMIVLFSVGLLALAAFVLFKKRRAVPSAV